MNICYSHIWQIMTTAQFWSLIGICLGLGFLFGYLLGSAINES